MTKFKKACVMYFSFVANLGCKQSDFLIFCFNNNINIKQVEEYVNKHYEKF